MSSKNSGKMSSDLSSSSSEANKIITINENGVILIPVKGYWDGISDNISDPCVLVFKAGKLVQVDKSLQGLMEYNPVEQEVWGQEKKVRIIADYAEKYVIPGMVDCHVHLALDGINFQQAMARWQDEVGWQQDVKERLTSTAKMGICLIRDGGDGAKIGLAAKRLREAWLTKEEDEVNFLPGIISVGEAVRRSDCYGSFLGTGISAVNDTLLHREIIRLKKAGIDQLKVLVSGIVSFNVFGKVGKLQFNQAELELLVKLAYEQELKVMAHVNSREGIGIAARAGVHSIEHGYFITEKLLEEMARKNIAWVPTVVPVANQVKLFGERYASGEKEVITKTYRRHLAMIKKAVEAGVKLGVGTDAGAAGVTHGAGFFQELKLFQEAGLSNPDILRAAVTWGREIAASSAEGTANKDWDKHPRALLVLADNPFHRLETLVKKPGLILARA